MKKVSEIAQYMRSNPSLAVGLDGSMDPRGSDPRNEELSNRRVRAIRDALVEAGVPISRIQTGQYGDARLRQDRRVAVMLGAVN
jgi:outer membrane protein OmpA-like peptidoglycan-associated protein